jgi:hypothetical protein
MLNKETLKVELAQMQKDMLKETDPVAAQEKFADKLATAIDNYIKSATVTATPAQVLEAAMSNGGGTVEAANNLISTLS